MKTLADVGAVVEQLFTFLWSRQRWWLMPLIVLLLLTAGLIVLGSAGGAGAFIYTFF